MYDRIVSHPDKKSFFLFGPRGTGKSTWLMHKFPGNVYLDLLSTGLTRQLLAATERLESFIPPGEKGWIIIDEIQNRHLPDHPAKGPTRQPCRNQRSCFGNIIHATD